ncbi:hypothetical protein Ccrd_009280, partial [Cynara cardunculus var. scolymus]
FWSLSCGGATNFVDSANISWVSDNEYITKGNTTTVDFNTSLRFFPDPGNRKCYKLPMNYTTSSSSLILVRANFVYKNYDGLEQPPLFSVSLGTAVAAFINLSFKDPWIEEFIWQQDNKDTLPLCLNSIPNGGFPVISSIEIRPIPQGGYYSGMDDFTNKYPLDQYDRIWDPDQDFSPFHTSTGFKTLGTFNTWGLKESPPQPILQTGRVLARREGLSYNFALKNLGDYYVVLYFAGILPVSPTFDVLINGDVVESNYSVKSWEVGSLYFLQKGIKSLNITFKDISFYPIVNAIEVYEIINIPPESSTTVVSALQVIRQSMGLDLEWEDDPCSPMPWEHIQCEGSSITSLNLSFNKLTSFGTDLDGLINLRVLDLKNNSLEGLVPESFGAMMNLHLLTSGNLCLSFSMSKCYDATANATIDAPQVTVFNKKKQTLHSHLAVVLGAVGGVLLVLIVVSILVFVYIRRKTPEFKHRERMKADLQMRNWNAAKAFSYKEIKAATRNFKQVLGRGSFGSVYLGKLPDGKLAAIKVRFDKTQLGANSFINEVSLLSSICHQNLVSLEGYCHEPKQQILVYEYLPGGSLADNIYGANSKRKTLSWVCRLKIAIDAAKGTNLSSSSAIMAKPYLQAGAFEIVDESLKETYDEESMRNTASIASRSVDSDASQRPTIAEVLAALKEAYSIQLSYLATAGAGLST